MITVQDEEDGFTFVINDVLGYKETRLILK